MGKEEKKLTSRQFRTVERILYDYTSYETAIRNLQIEIENINVRAGASIIKYSAEKPCFPYSPQERLYLRIEKLRNMMAEKSNRKEAVEKAVKVLSAEDMKLVELTYFEQLPKWRIWQLLRLPSSTYYKRKERVVSKVAKYLGIV